MVKFVQQQKQFGRKYKFTTKESYNSLWVYLALF